MIDSLILRTATRAVVPLILLFSVYMLTWGHDQPGGGFSGGLIAALAYALYAFAFGTKQTRRALPGEPQRLIGAGLGMAVFAGTVGLVVEGHFLADVSMHLSLWNDAELALGTALLFDVGVYVIVLGTVVALTFAFEEAFTSILPQEEDMDAP